jgi:hypothetical protein
MQCRCQGVASERKCGGEREFRGKREFHGFPPTPTIRFLFGQQKMFVEHKGLHFRCDPICPRTYRNLVTAACSHGSCGKRRCAARRGTDGSSRTALGRWSHSDTHVDSWTTCAIQIGHVTRSACTSSSIGAMPILWDANNVPTWILRYCSSVENAQCCALCYANSQPQGCV